MTTFEQTIEQSIARARSRNVLLPLQTETANINDDDGEYIVRWLSSLMLKDLAKLPAAGDKPTNFNPFLPYEPDLFVADVSPTHVCILNKFPVERRHLLLVTKSFVDQETPLGTDDWEALAWALCQMDALAFYNSGTVAGASQAHKHLQLVVEPSIPLAGRFPTDTPVGIPTRIDCLRFRHAFIRLNPAMFGDVGLTSQSLGALYQAGCAFAGLPVDAGHDVANTTSPAHQMAMPPYNLLLTRNWMLIVPRSRECWEHAGTRISINAMSFTGSIFVRHADQMAMIREAGPMKLLEAVTFPLEE